MRLSTLTKEDPSDDCMSIEASLVVDIAERYPIQLRSISATSSIDSEEDWPSHAAADATNEDNDPKKSQEEVSLY